MVKAKERRAGVTGEPEGPVSATNMGEVLPPIIPTEEEVRAWSDEARVRWVERLSSRQVFAPVEEAGLPPICTQDVVLHLCRTCGWAVEFANLQPLEEAMFEGLFRPPRTRGSRFAKQPQNERVNLFPKVFEIKLYTR
jgi:hypothetical protein